MVGFELRKWTPDADAITHSLFVVHRPSLIFHHFSFPLSALISRPPKLKAKLVKNQGTDPSHSPLLIQRLIHRLPPLGPEPPHRPDNNAARHGDDAHARKQPPITNSVDQRLRDDGPDAGKDVADEVVDGDAVGGALGHEFRQHGRGHGEDEHGADAEEEVGDQGHEPEDAPLRRPAVPDQRGRVQECRDPGVFAHPVFGSVEQLALVVVAARALGFARHDVVGPFAAEEGGEEVAD